MRIGIVGADDLGATLTELWTNAGHQVAVGHVEAASATALAERLGPSVQATTVEEAARFGDVVVLTGAYERSELRPPSSAVAGKIVVDAMNAVTASGQPSDLGGRRSSEVLAGSLPGAAMIKALNTITAERLRAESRPSVPREQRFAMILAGDDARAKERVSTLIEELGFTPVDAGSLSLGGRLLEPGSELFGRVLLPADARRTLQLMG